MKRKLFITVCVVLLLVVVAIVASYYSGQGWIVYHDGPYKGKVIDADTGAPIEGAAVVGMWKLEAYGGPGGPVGVYCDAQETVTDRNGEFTVPKAFCFNLWPFTKLGMAEFVVFKPGHLAYPPIGATSEERKRHMPDFTGHEFKDAQLHPIIKLGMPKTFEEKRSTLASVDISYIEKAPYLQKLVNVENKALGYERK